MARYMQPRIIPQMKAQEQGLAGLFAESRHRADKSASHPCLTTGNPL